MNDAYIAAEVEAGPEVGRGARHIRLVVAFQAVGRGKVTFQPSDKSSFTTNALTFKVSLFNGDHHILTVDEAETREEIERYLAVWVEALGWPVLRFTEHDSASTFMREVMQDE